MICAVHALVGATIGRLVGRRNGAFAAGVATHLIGDLLPHKDLPPKVEAPLLAITLGAIALKSGIMSPEFFGAVGGFSPDFENAAGIAGIIPKDAMRFPTHVRGGIMHGPRLKSALPQGVLALGCALYLFSRKR